MSAAQTAVAAHRIGRHSRKRPEQRKPESGLQRRRRACSNLRAIIAGGAAQIKMLLIGGAPSNRPDLDLAFTVLRPPADVHPTAMSSAIPLPISTRCAFTSLPEPIPERTFHMVTFAIFLPAADRASRRDGSARKLQCFEHLGGTCGRLLAIIVPSSKSAHRAPMHTALVDAGPLGVAFRFVNAYARRKFRERSAWAVGAGADIGAGKAMRRHRSRRSKTTYFKCDDTSCRGPAFSDTSLGRAGLAPLRGAKQL